MLASMLDDGFDQPAPEAGLPRMRPHIHAPKQPLMRVLRTGLDNEPGDTQQFRPVKSPEHRGAADPLREKRQWLFALDFERAAERVGISLQPFKAHLAEERRVVGGQPAQFDRCSCHCATSAAAFSPVASE